VFNVSSPEEQIDLFEVNDQMVELEKEAKKARDKHNEYLKELGLPPI
jgi:type I restriction enzyme M protein